MDDCFLIVDGGYGVEYGNIFGHGYGAGTGFCDGDGYGSIGSDHGYGYHFGDEHGSGSSLIEILHYMRGYDG